MRHKVVKNKQWRIEKKIPAAVCNTIKHQYIPMSTENCVCLYLPIALQDYTGKSPGRTKD